MGDETGVVKTCVYRVLNEILKKYIFKYLKGFKEGDSVISCAY